MIYIKKNDFGAVTDYLKNDDGSVKEFDYDQKTNELLINQGYIYVHLIDVEKPLFNELANYYTYYEGQLHRPFNFDRKIIESILNKEEN